ncbi:MAG: GNAT family N-acetyltransferase [Candidatus Binataceae bacterium]
MEECESVLQLWKLTGSGPSVTDTVAHLRMLTRECADLFLVAMIGDQIAGSILGGWDNWRGHIYRLAVHPARRRRGLARALVAEIERRLRNRGARRIYALTYTADGLKFWSSSQYERTTDTAFVRTFTDARS